MDILDTYIVQIPPYVAVPPHPGRPAVMRALSFWDEWLWPLIAVSSWEIRPMGSQVLYLASDIGAHTGRQMAGFVIASVPMIILFIVASKQFIEGLASGAMKF